MKRFALLPLALLALSLLVPALVGQTPPEKKPPLAFASPLLPLKIGNRWTYQGVDPKEKIVVTVERMEPIRRRTGTGGLESLESYILKTTNGDKSQHEQLYVSEDGIYRYSLGGKEIVPPLKIMSVKPTVGETWNCDSLSENTPLKGQFVVESKTVELPTLGKQAAWVSKTKDFTVGDHKLESMYCWVPNIGIVQQHIKVGKFDQRTVLEDFKSPGPAAPPPPSVTLPDLPLPK